MSIEAVTTALTTALAHGGEPRAGGTDVMARRGVGRATGPFVDLGVVPGMRGIEWRPDGSVRIAAMTTVAEVAVELRDAYPALAATAGALATPQIRAVATIGGNLLQRNRCWYYRNPAFSCFQSGGDGCPAREGDHLYSVVIDESPCVAPHPSSMAVALLACDAKVEVHGRDAVPVAELYSDDPSHDHQLAAGEVLLAVVLPPPFATEHGSYHRAIARAHAEWPLVEAVARLELDQDGVITAAGVAVGGVARTPLRLPEVEAALVGAHADEDTLVAAARLAEQRCTPLPGTKYKVTLLVDTVLEVLARASGVPCDIRDHARRAD
ncbi:FAD binding domain-containing protein [Labedaea rhizosphaerae]|uniref:Xanthine dehydrogenase YagS FAD-binding subunit n=1 Tax=Labedaea rhizosphaerae TaxID=598644 RepID=A0A4R6S7X8_LABRH|nr:FAD binding domain-containing protein [Labedaea rhizosphaerae]TDP94936.1 xanthine dehydrogenase YagS FAD-binding subunit [Labedaea rhizosphaerae]